jgi:hypothetical protein
MRTVLFVHGTGTRDPAYSLMLERIRISLAGHATVERCYWGETEGAKLHAAGASIPEYQSTRAAFSSALRALEPEDQEDYEIALWGLLLMDPLVELRLLATIAGNSGGLGIGKVPAPPHFDRLAEWNTTLAADDKLRSNIPAAALSALIPEACDIVKGSKLFVDAEARGDEQACRVAAARAVLATAFFLAEERDLPSPARTDADLRDNLVDGFTRLLDPTGCRGAVSPRSFIRNHLAKPLLGLAMYAGANVASTWARRRRGAISDAASATAGDILLYQARGAGIRRFIKEQIEGYERDVVLLAHSLGGVACVDLLALEKLPQIVLLVTVGCQAPFFYEIGALQSLEFADVPPERRLPDHFPQWLNFYDLRDFLSYVGQPVFGQNRVVDFQIDSRLPFPDSHGGYFSNAEVWARTVASLP